MKTRTVIPLDGIWQMAADADNRGKKESWFASDPPPEAHVLSLEGGDAWARWEVNRDTGTRRIWLPWLMDVEGSF